jgi:hypothetical protein
LTKIGAPQDSILVDDLSLLDTKPYKLVIFLNCFHLNDAQRHLIRHKILNQGRTVLWCYAPGLFNGPNMSVDAMRELTGMNLTRAENPNLVRARIALTDEGVRLGGEPMERPQIIGREQIEAHLISVEDKEAVTLGRVEGRGEVALALKSQPGWTSVYSLNPVLPATFLRGLARRAGVHIYNERDDTLYACRSYLTLAADGAGPRSVRLPRKMDVVDPFTNTVQWKGVTQFTQDFQDKETAIWRLA